MPNCCIVCGHTKRKGDSSVSMFRIPAEKSRRNQWLEALDIEEGCVTEHSRVCNRHFRNGDSSNIPSMNPGKRFASPKKLNTERSKRATKRSLHSPSLITPPPSKAQRSQSSPSSSMVSSLTIHTPASTTDDEPMSVSIGEPLLSDYSVCELPAEDDNQASCIALGARVELLEAEDSYVRRKVTNTSQCYFRVEQIADNDSLIKKYTGFDSYWFFEFL